MTRIAEVDRPGMAVRAFYTIGQRMFGVVPTPEKLMAHRIPQMIGLGAFYMSLERFGLIDASLRALLNLHVARVRGSAY